MSVWDEFVHRVPSRIKDKSTGDIAADSYHQLERDIALLELLGVHAYRFSISWSRILPKGDSARVNEKGVQYYDKLINLLISKNIVPFVTMYHWDSPQELQRIGGWSNKLMADYFVDYARILFQRFGDRVRNWITFNEPTEFCGSGYGDYVAAPAMNLQGFGGYICMHNIIVAHAKVYQMYQRDFHADQRGEIGITLNNDFVFQRGNGTEFVDRFMAFTLGWQMDPIFAKPFHGYPELMRQEIQTNSDAEKRSRSRLPEFTTDEIDLLKGKTVDFLGLNYYTSRIVERGHFHREESPYYWKDVNLTIFADSKWKRAKSDWLYFVPEGLHHLLVWIKRHYDSPKIYITENGWSDDGEIVDQERINYLREHLKSIQKAKVDGVDVRGYFHWSLMDNFEWDKGYT